MRLRSNQIRQHLQQNLASVYFISGDEPLQMMETTDAIRLAAKKAGFIERKIIEVEIGFNWQRLQAESSALSLFTQKKIIDLRFPSGKLGIKGSKALQNYVRKISPDHLLLIQTGRLNSRTTKSAWVKALDKAGVWIQIWDLSPVQTLAWIKNKMQQAGFQASQTAIQILTDRIEGNLLAAAQEINKLQLLYPTGNLTDEQILTAVVDSSHFSSFDLSDAILSQNLKRIQHILQILKEEGNAIPLILWVITDLLRRLYNAAFQLKNGKTEFEVLRFIPRPKQELFRQALYRMQNEQNWSLFFKKAAKIDRLSKGISKIKRQNEQIIWDEILKLSFLLAGKSIL